MKIRQILGWCIAALCAGVGAAIYILMYSHRFIGYAFIALAAYVTIQLLLQLLGKKAKRTSKVLRLICSVLFGLGILAAATTGFHIATSSGGDIEEPCDYLIVLGCAVNEDTPSQMLQYRINAAYTYLKKNPNTQCIVTGGLGQGDVITEAQCMYNELTDRGIASDRIWLEEKATSTKESFVNVKALLQEKTGGIPDNIGVLSSEYHLYRAKEIAKDQGINVYTVPAKTQRIGLLASNSIREILAVWKYILGV